MNGSRPDIHSTISLFFAMGLAVSMGAAGCFLPPPPSKYYVASIDTSHATVSPEEGLKILDSRAGRVLRPGVKVAFFPPDYCRNISAASSSPTPEAVELANDCGVLVSELENAIADRYTVVSWQTLKGDDPFGRAEARKVDVIFEVDSFGLNTQGGIAESQTDLNFYEQTDATDRAPLILDSKELSAIANRCKKIIDHLQGARDAGEQMNSFTGAIKAVEVSSGQALVYYRRTLTDDPGIARDGFDMYFKSQGRYAPAPFNKDQWAGFGLLIASGVLTPPGIVLTGVGADLKDTEDPSEFTSGNPQAEKGTRLMNAGIPFLAIGVVLAATGVALIGIGNKKARSGHLAVSPSPPAYQAPSEVICKNLATPPWLVRPENSSTAEAARGSSYSFVETQTAGRDSSRDRESHLRKLVIDDFAKALGEL